MALKVNNTNIVNNDRSFTLVNANPASPLTGQIRFTTADGFQVYNGSAWVAIANKTPIPTNAYTWGNGEQAILGQNTGTNVSRSSPVTIVGPFSDWKQISVSQYHMAAVRQWATASAWCWGQNFRGQLGNNATTAFNSATNSSPVSVVGGFTDWKQISAGDEHTAAVRYNGSIWCWGQGTEGRLGNNAATQRSSPVSVVGGFTDWQSVSAGFESTLALRSNGTAWGWGRTSYGRLGNNSAFPDRSSPVSVVGGFTWIQVVTSNQRQYSMGIRTNGTAWGWGRNDDGQIGNNTTTSASSPVSVVGGFTDWTQLALAYKHTQGVRANGTAWGWGFNNNGCIGNGLGSGSPSSPVSVVGGFTDWIQISAGRNFSMALRANGTLWGWGYVTSGQVGNNNPGPGAVSSPVSVVGGFTDWVMVAAGWLSTAGVRQR